MRANVREAAAFQVNALLIAVNQAVRLGNDDSVAIARKAVDGLPSTTA